MSASRPEEAVDGRPPRHCYKCGREIGPDESICEVCNRAGMATPSASQYHGTIVVAIIAAVVLLAVGASLAMRGMGPYDGRAVGFHADGGTVVATVAVSNQGTKQGRARCRIVARDAGGRELGAVTSVTPPIGGGRTITYDETIPGVGGESASVAVSCQ